MAELADLWPEGAVVSYTPKWAKYESPITRIYAQETGVVMRTTASHVFVRYGTDQTPKATDSDDLVLLISPGAYVWKPGDPEDVRIAWEAEEHGLRQRLGGAVPSRAWLSDADADALAKDVAPHPFWLPDGYYSPACMQMVERGDGGDQCGLPAAHRIHDDPSEGQDFDYGRTT